MERRSFLQVLGLGGAAVAIPLPSAYPVDTVADRVHSMVLPIGLGLNGVELEPVNGYRRYRLPVHAYIGETGEMTVTPVGQLKWVAKGGTLQCNQYGVKGARRLFGFPDDEWVWFDFGTLTYRIGDAVITDGNDLTIKFGGTHGAA